VALDRMVLHMRTYPKALARVMEELEKMPGIGPKSAQRLALYLLRASVEDARALAESILEMKQAVHLCRICFNLTDDEVCPICSDPQRDESLICVVSDVRDLLALERTGSFRGRYHVLGGLISPMEGVGPESLRLRELLERVRSGVREVILATNPTVEGDATALYIAGLLKPLGIKVTRIALGLPVGGDLDYADEVTVARAVSGRTEL
jgi:recombination protein RecR